MKVFDLQCEQGHRFEGWFASEPAFVEQRDTQLIECPICASVKVTRLPSAARLNLSRAAAPAGEGRAQESQGAPGPQASPAAQAEASSKAHQANWLRAMKAVLAQAEDVGERFAEEARRIHYKESKPRAIRGVASQDEATALADEGIEVVALPLPVALKKTLQ